jgi:hypothetical protein
MIEWKDVNEELPDKECGIFDLKVKDTRRVYKKL